MLNGQEPSLTMGRVAHAPTIIGSNYMAIITIKIQFGYKYTNLVFLIIDLSDIRKIQEHT